MRKMHWSEPYLNFISIEITYNDGSIQTWDYECIQFETIEELRENMVLDFTEPRLDRSEVMLHFTQVENHYTVDLENTDTSTYAFADLVLGSIEDEIGGIVS